MRGMLMAGAVLASLGLTLHTLPYLVRDQAVIWLRSQGVETAGLRSLSVNWWRGELELRDLKAHRQGQKPLDIGRLQVRLDYPALFDKQLRIRVLQLEDVISGYTRQGDQHWLGPLDLNALVQPATAEEAAPADEPSQWGLGLDVLALDRIDWTLALQNTQHIEIDTLRLGALHLWQPELETPLQISARINGSPLALESVAVPLAVDKRGELSLKLDSLDLQALANPWLPELSGRLTTDLTLSAALQGEQLILKPSGRVELTDFVWQGTPFSAQVPNLSWQGDLGVQLDAFNLSTLQLDGELALAQGAQLAPNTGLTVANKRLQWQGKVDLARDAEGALQLATRSSISAAKVQVLQQGEQPVSVDLDELKWNGDLQLQQAAAEQATLNLQGSQALSLGALAVNLTGAQPLRLNLAAADWALQGVQLTLPAGAIESLQLKASQALQLQALQLQLGEPQQQVSAELTSAALKGALTGSALQRWTLADNQLALGSVAVSLAPASKLSLTGLTSQLSLNADTLSGDVRVKAPSLDLGKLDLQVSGAALAQLTKTSAKGIDFALPLAVSLEQLSLNGLSAGSSVAGGKLLELDGGRIAKLALKENDLRIASVDLNGLRSKVILDAKMQPVDIQALQRQLEGFSGGSVSTKAKPEPASSSKDKPLRLRIAQVKLGGNSQLQFEDRSTQPVFKAGTDIESMQISAIDTGSSKPSRFSLAGTVNRFAKLSAEGELNLIGDERNGNWTLALQGLELPSISPYSLKYTGYYLKSGQLSLDLKGTLKASQLDGKNTVRLHRLAVQEADAQKIADFQQRISMPLGTAVAVLQDKNDNIDLDIPISGSLDDPQFDYQGIINRVAGAGLKQGVMGFLMKSLQPYGTLISLAQTAIQASQTGAFISLAPVQFVAGASEFNAGQQDYLQQLSKLLNERQALRLNLCGVAVKAEREPLAKALAEENSQRKEPLAAEALAQELDGRLEQLASARAETIKQQLQATVPAERLFLCYPQIDQEGEARVDLAL